MAKAIRMAHHLRFAKMPKEAQGKNNVVQIIPAVLYGVEAARGSSAELEKLRSAIANVHGPTSAKGSVDVVFSVSKSANDMDPNTKENKAWHGS